MSKPAVSPDPLQAYFREEKVATLADLKRVLRTTGTMTVFRKLKALGYLSSYSHRGKYYTLQDIPEFDELGLWNWNVIWFSRYGNLVQTAREFVEDSDSGFTARELESLLHVECKRALLKLTREKQLQRLKIGGVYVYLSGDRDRQRRQERIRRAQAAGTDVVPTQVEAFSHELKAAIILFFSLLDERQRRLYAGLESQKSGHGGDTKIAELLGLDVHTVAQGRRQLFSGDVGGKGVRRPGGGRKRQEKKPRTSSR
jgi:hypothetical protein